MGGRRRTTWRAFVAAATAVCCLAVKAAGAPPAEWLFPAGVQRGQTATVTVGGRHSTWPVNAWCSSEHVKIAADKKSGTLLVSADAAAIPAAYWVRLYDGQGASTPRPLIVGTLPEVTEIEPNDTPRQAQRLTSSSVVVNGRLASAGDVDAFAVALRKGQTLVADVEANRTLASPMDAVLQLAWVDAASGRAAVLEQNDDAHGLDPRIAFTATRDGEYLVRLFAFPATPDGTLGFAGGATYIYRLTLTTGPFVDYSLPLAIGADSPEIVSLIGWNIPAAWAAFRPAAAKPGDEVVHLWHADLANWFDLPRLSYPSLIEKESAGGTTSGTISTGAAALKLPVCVTGRIDPSGDQDAFRFTATKGQRLRFQAESRALGYPLDPVLTLRDGKGTVLAENDDRDQQRDALLDYTVPADGQYEIVLRDVHGHGGPRYAYRLRAQIVREDFALSVPADGFLLTKDKPLSITVKIDRRDGFGDAVEVRAIGLPKEIACPAAVSGSSGATAASVQLTLHASASFGGGPFRIVGTSRSKAPATRTAKAPVPATGASIEDLWLSVAGAK